MNTSYCDIVMKGGVTSGVVYPPAIVEISRTFSFKNVGGTSAGAIAAAMTAAAQLGRLRGSESGFDLLAKMPDELAANNLLFKLFHPNRATSALFQAVTALAAHSSGPQKVVSLMSAHPAASIAGALPALGLFLSSQRHWYHLLLAVPLALGGGACAAMVAFANDFKQRVPANGYGLVTGITDDGTNAPALTTWLEAKLQAAAGITDASVPLTFGMLWDAAVTGPCALAERPPQPNVNLEMITTCLTLGRPYKFPFETSRFFFRPDALRRYFPEHVVGWMIRTARQPRDEREKRRFPEQAKRGFLPMPPIGDVPVILATRMSLSFPILFSAVPLAVSDFGLKRNQETASNPVVPLLEECWFTDGGLSSNFPVALFDAPLPRWPTFAVDLDGFRDGETPNADQSKNVWMPQGNGAIARQFNRFSGLPAFLGTIFTTMQNWGDTTQAVLPGYRDRIVTVLLDGSEGGLNLDMPPDVLARLRDRGAAAGALVASRFSDAAGRPPESRMNWSNHRWLRLRTLLAALQAYLEAYLESYDADSAAWTQLVNDPPEGSYRISSFTAAKMLTLLQNLRALGAEFERAPELADEQPKPPPHLTLRPDLSSGS